MHRQIHLKQSSLCGFTLRKTAIRKDWKGGKWKPPSLTKSCADFPLQQPDDLFLSTLFLWLRLMTDYGYLKYQYSE